MKYKFIIIAILLLAASYIGYNNTKYLEANEVYNKIDFSNSVAYFECKRWWGHPNGGGARNGCSDKGKYLSFKKAVERIDSDSEVDEFDYFSKYDSYDYVRVYFKKKEYINDPPFVPIVKQRAR